MITEQPQCFPLTVYFRMFRIIIFSYGFEMHYGKRRVTNNRAFENINFYFHVLGIVAFVMKNHYLKVSVGEYAFLS